MKTRTLKLTAEICLYGNGPSGCGSGWLARTADGRLLGDGSPCRGDSMTDAMWYACSAIRQFVKVGTVRVFAPRGELMADTDLNHPGYFGDLKWVPATAYVIAVADALAAASA